MAEDEVECPTCGAVYENAFAQRFDIANDEGRMGSEPVDLRAPLRRRFVSVSEITRSDYPNSALDQSGAENGDAQDGFHVCQPA